MEELSKIWEILINLFDEYSYGSEVSDVIEQAIGLLRDNFTPVFRMIRWPIELLIENIEAFLLWVPWPIIVVVAMLLAWRSVDWRVSLLSGVGLVCIGFLGLWNLTMTTLSMVLASMSFCVIVGIPLGILSARSDRINGVVRAMLDAMQTVHPFVYLVPIVFLFGIGKVPGTIATIIFALPPMVRLTNLGIRQVPTEVVEAARAFGSNDRQLLFDVQLPLALPTIMAGVNQTLMLSLSMVVIVALIAGGGLGEEIYRAIGRVDVGRAIVAGIAVLILAVIIDRISQGEQTKPVS